MRDLRITETTMAKAGRQSGIARDKLTKKQRAFITGYPSNGFNATRAAIAAGYSEDSAYSIGSENLRKPEIAAVIEEELEKRGITPVACKILLGEVALDTDITDFEPWLRGEKTFEELRAGGVNTALAKTARISEKGARSIELHDRLAAVKELNRLLGLVTKKQEITAHVEAAMDFANMPRDELERLAHAAGLEPADLPHWPADELESWAGHIEAERQRRLGSKPANPDTS